MSETVTVFKSQVFDPSSESDSDPIDRPPGKDVATFFQNKLLAKGVEVGNLLPEKGGWDMDLWMEGTPFCLLVRQAEVGNPPEDFWAVMARKKPGAIGQIFGLKQDPEEAAPVQAQVEEILEESGETDHVQRVQKSQVAAHI